MTVEELRANAFNHWTTKHTPTRVTHLASTLRVTFVPRFLSGARWRLWKDTSEVFLLQLRHQKHTHTRNKPRLYSASVLRPEGALKPVEKRHVRSAFTMHFTVRQRPTPTHKTHLISAAKTLNAAASAGRILRLLLRLCLGLCWCLWKTVESEWQKLR